MPTIRVYLESRCVYAARWFISRYTAKQDHSRRFQPSKHSSLGTSTHAPIQLPPPSPLSPTTTSLPNLPTILPARHIIPSPPHHIYPPATQRRKNKRTNRLASTQSYSTWKRVPSARLHSCCVTKTAMPGRSMSRRAPRFWTMPTLPRDRNIRSQSQSQGVRVVEMFRLPPGMVGGGEVPVCRCLCHDGVGVGGGIAV